MSSCRLSPPRRCEGWSFSSLCLVPQDLVTSSPTADDETSASTETASRRSNIVLERRRHSAFSVRARAAGVDSHH